MGDPPTHQPSTPCGLLPSAHLRVTAAYIPSKGLTPSTGKSDPSAKGAPALRRGSERRVSSKEPITILSERG